jgi:hypothetical protein
MDKVQKHNSFNTNAPSSESYRNYPFVCLFVVLGNLLTPSKRDADNEPAPGQCLPLET